MRRAGWRCTLQLVARFLARGEYKKGSRNIAARVMSSVKSGVGLGRSPSSSGADAVDAMEAAQKDLEGEPAEREDSNVPFRIILSLLDEVFGLQDNQWMRKKVMFVLKTVIRATMGGGINRKVDAAIDAAVSTEQVAEYIIQFRDTWWPNGVAAPEASERSQDCRTRTRVEAKSKLLGTLPDELKTIIGSKSAVAGILSVFEMLQYERLNKRLMYTVLEAALKKVGGRERAPHAVAGLSAPAVKSWWPLGGGCFTFCRPVCARANPSHRCPSSSLTATSRTSLTRRTPFPARDSQRR